MLHLTLKQNGPLWKIARRLRKDRVSGSEIGSVLGINRFRSNKALFKQKTDPLGVPDFDNEDMRRGREEEPKALAYLSGCPGFWNHEWLRPGIVLGKGPFGRLMCSPDAMFVRGGGKELEGVEVKTKRDPDKIPRSVEEIPDDNLLQCFISAQICGARGWYLLYWNHREPDESQLFYVSGEPRNSWFVSLLLDKVKTFTIAVEHNRLDLAKFAKIHKGGVKMREGIEVRTIYGLEDNRKCPRDHNPAMDFFSLQ